MPRFQPRHPSLAFLAPQTNCSVTVCCLQTRLEKGSLLSINPAVNQSFSSTIYGTLRILISGRRCASLFLRNLQRGNQRAIDSRDEGHSTTSYHFPTTCRSWLDQTGTQGQRILFKAWISFMAQNSHQHVARVMNSVLRGQDSEGRDTQTAGGQSRLSDNRGFTAAAERRSRRCERRKSVEDHDELADSRD